MWQSLADIAPLLILIGIGVVLRATGIVNEQSRLALTRISYYVTIPVVILTSLAKAELTPGMALLPLIGFGLPVLLSGIMYLATRRLPSQASRGTMIIAMVGLVVFGYPIGQIMHGDAGVARVAMYDIGNVLYISTVALWVAQAYGTKGRQNLWMSLLAILKSPFIWAALAGVLIGRFKLPLDGIVGDVLGRLAAANTPLVMIAVGSFLNPKVAQGKLVLLIAFVRILLGGVIAWLAALALGLRGMDLALVAMLASLPVGTTPLIYSSNEGLDPELAASAISATVMIGLVVVSVLPNVLALIYPAG
ncbi:MAG: AEC family transporter [Anaerolineae bacterium]